MTEDCTKVESFGDFKLNDTVVRMDSGPSSIYKIVEMYDDGVFNIRVNSESGLKCKGSWVFYKYLRKATDEELKLNHREGNRHWPEVPSGETLNGFAFNQLVVLKDPSSSDSIFHITKLIKTGQSISGSDTGMAEIASCYYPAESTIWVSVEELRHPTNSELQCRKRSN